MPLTHKCDQKAKKGHATVDEQREKCYNDVDICFTRLKNGGGMH